MRLAPLLTAAALASGVSTCTLAHAQSVSQVQLDNSFAVLNLHVDDAGDVAGAAVAGGNAYTTLGHNADVNFYGHQYSEGDATAQANATVWNADGAVIVSATATANGLTAAAQHGANWIDGDQESHGDTTAETRTQTGYVGASASSAAAGANVAALTSENGDLISGLRQTSTGNVSASVEADHCCVSTAAVADSVASANNIAMTGTTTTMLSGSRQISSGDSVSARVDLYAGLAGDAVGNATANGNALTADNAWGYVNIYADQRNSADVTAESYVTLGGDWLGVGSAASYGVGNSAMVSNVGSDVDLDIAQTNAGAVGSYAALAGQGGDAALVSSAAYGNVIGATLCAQCGDNPVLTASSVQTNSGPVTSHATVITPGANYVGASATAIGNAASYSVNNQH